MSSVDISSFWDMAMVDLDPMSETCRLVGVGCWSSNSLCPRWGNQVLKGLAACGACPIETGPRRRVRVARRVIACVVGYV